MFVKVQFRAYFLGLALYWAWIALVFYSDTFFIGLDGADSLVNSFWLWATWAHALSLIILAVCASSIESLLPKRVFLALSAIGMCVGTVSVAVVSYCSSIGYQTFSLAFLAASAVIVGVSSSWHVLLWGKTFGQLSARALPLASFISIALGLLLYFVFQGIPSILRAVTTGILPILSAVCIHVSSKGCLQKHGENHGQKQSVVHFAAFNYIPLVFSLFAFAFCGEMLRAFCTGIAAESLNRTGGLYLFGGLAGLGVFIAYLFSTKKSGALKPITVGTVRMMLLAMALGFLIAPFIGTYSYAVSYGIFGAGFWCIRAISWVFCCLLASRLSCNLVRAIAIMDASFALSVVVSSQVNSWIADIIKVGFAEITTVSLVTVFMLMVIALFLPNGKVVLAMFAPTESVHPFDDGAPEEGSLKSSSDLEPDIEQLRQRYGLTPRELEVANLLARGRSLPFIQKQLFISAGTVNSHVRHIYKKMGVHTRQEFIDIIEGFKEQTFKS